VTARPLPTIAVILTLSLVTMPVPAASLLANSLRLVNSPAPNRGQISRRCLPPQPSRAELKRFRCVLRAEDVRPAPTRAVAPWAARRMPPPPPPGRWLPDDRGSTMRQTHLRC